LRLALRVERSQARHLRRCLARTSSVGGRQREWDPVSDVPTVAVVCEPSIVAGIEKAPAAAHRLRVLVVGYSVPSFSRWRTRKPDRGGRTPKMGGGP
jgi:hypothetical protein